jgi:molybdopterin-guanine dinucleotide biosynthesis protein MobB
MSHQRIPSIVSIVGRKNSGKTTFLIALAATLKERGWRIASVKHGHHEFEIDQPGRDSWRHFHEGGVEAVMMIARGKIALISREGDEPDPEELIRRHLLPGGYDLILVEGYKHGPFAKVEIHRSALHPLPLAAEGGPTANPLALVTDLAGEIPGPSPVVPLLPDGSHVRAVADLLERRFLTRDADAS